MEKCREKKCVSIREDGGWEPRRREIAMRNTHS